MSDEGKSYLEFGKKKADQKTVYDLREGQEAYEFFMVARYLKDIIGYRTGDIKKVHHPEDLKDNLKKYIALSVCSRKSKGAVFYEVGSSLMGAIDALDYLDLFFDELNSKDVTFLGIDNSYMMNEGAAYLHPHHEVKTSTKIEPKDCDLFFAKGVSILYAFDNEELFCNVLKKSKISIFDYTFALKGQIKTVIGTGKSVTFLNLNKCKQLLEDEERTLVLLPSKRVQHEDPNKATFECIYGYKEIVKTYLEEFKEKMDELRSSISQK